MDFRELRRQLPPLADRVYLNTGTSGPMPVDAYRAGEQLAQQVLREGFSSPPVLQAYGEVLGRAREAFARVIGANPGEIALMHSTSEGIGTIATGINWRPGDEVIVSDLEHMSGVAPWEYLARYRGVKVVNLRSEDGGLSARQVEEAITDSTRLIFVSHVSYSTGAELPVAEVCALARERGVMVLVDGAQSAGHIPVDVESIGCDFYAFPGQKWLLGPEGTGALYVRRSALEWLDPIRIGWASVAGEDAGGTGIILHGGARRFETGTENASDFAALAASVGILESVGWSRIAARARELAALARSELSRIDGVEIVTPAARATGLLTFAVRGADPDAVVKRLWETHRVVIRSIPRPKALRASFHAFNNEEDVKCLAEGLKDVLAGLRG